MRVAKTPGRTMRFASYLLTVSMVLGFPGPGLVHGATAATAPTASGSLSVETDPPGATVLVDGQAWGTTPVAVRPIAPGDHRVRVVKQGYLDNSRVVSVQAGQVGRVQVKLTPNGNAAAARPQVDTAPPPQKKEGGGSGKKIALITVGALAVGAVAYKVATKNDPPVPGTIVVSPTGVGLMAVTSFTVTAQGASDPDGDTLTYNWDFGDGGTGSGSSASHVYTREGSFTVALTVSDGKKTATAPSASVTVRSLSGTWRGTATGSGFNISFTAVLTQTGTALSGTYTDPGGPAPISGTVSAPRNITVTVTYPGIAPIPFTGTANAELTSISGTAAGFLNFTMTR